MAGSIPVHALELANLTREYQWNRDDAPMELTTLFPASVTEHLTFSEVFSRMRSELSRLGIDVCLLPSYSPKQSLAALLAAKSLGVRTVMMNETHAGTARATGVAALVKRQLVRLFDTALVGGEPHRRYFASLGMPKQKIFTGYDAIDNDYFVRRAAEVQDHKSWLREKYDLPPRYFLSLGRFIAKKNLTTLIEAYRKFLSSEPATGTHLVVVGDGEEGSRLRSQCARLKLPVYEKADAQPRSPKTAGSAPGVHFYGFRQIEENPVFYAFADAFILPSLYEEWGLVVNEAMASGLPVVVSERAGCAEDLLSRGIPSDIDVRAVIPRVRQAGLRQKLRRNGFVFDPQSGDELSSALTLLNSFPRLRAAMSQSSRGIVDRCSCENFARNALLAARTAMGERVSHEETAAGEMLATPPG